MNEQHTDEAAIAMLGARCDSRAGSASARPVARRPGLGPRVAQRGLARPGPDRVGLACVGLACVGLACIVAAGCDGGGASIDGGLDAGTDGGVDAAPPPLDPREITEPMPLLADDGTVAAHGWSRGPLMEYDRARVASEVADRVREWEYYAVFAPTFALSVTLTNIGIASVATLSVQDYASGDTSSETLLGGPDDLALPSTPFESTRWERPNGWIDYAYDAGARTIGFRAGMADVWERAQADLVVWDDPAGQSIAVVTRFSDPRLFFYENKRVGLTATGSVRIGETTWTLPAEGAYAVIDWGRGAWPRDVGWEWAAASGTSGGHRIGINLGSVHGDDSHGTADGVVVDGVLHKMGRVRWELDLDHLEQPWRFTSDDGRIDLTLAPDFDESSTLDLGRYSMRNWKMHGAFSGTVVLDDGSTLLVEGVRGAAEHVEIAW